MSHLRLHVLNESVVWSGGMHLFYPLRTTGGIVRLLT